MSRKYFKRLVSRKKLKKTGFTGYVYNFSVDYNAIAVDDIKDIYKHLMKKKICYDKYVHIPKKVIYKNVCIY